MKQHKKAKPRQKEKDGIKIFLPMEQAITKESIKANAGFLGMKGKLIKSLMEEKKREREL